MNTKGYILQREPNLNKVLTGYSVLWQMIMMLLNIIFRGSSTRSSYNKQNTDIQNTETNIDKICNKKECSDQSRDQQLFYKNDQRYDQKQNQDSQNLEVREGVLGVTVCTRACSIPYTTRSLRPSTFRQLYFEHLNIQNIFCISNKIALKYPAPTYFK